jgi:hypothetical protein
MNEYDVQAKFRQDKIMTIEKLMDVLQCSAITVRRRLKKWEAFTSINKNGRYYTLPEIPEFDGNGLWKYQSALFSKHGNLRQTIIALVRKSQKGLSAADISQTIEIPSTSSYFSQIKNSDGIKREKHQGRFFYFADSPAKYQRQKKGLGQQRTDDWITDAQAVKILVHLIKNPGIEVDQLAIESAPPGKRFDPDTVKQFLQFHDLLKKTSDTEQ